MNSKQQLLQYNRQVNEELERLLLFWSTTVVDEECGGFFGELDAAGTPVAGAPKGAVLNMRILWTFSAASQLPGFEQYHTVAERAYRYCRDHFLDYEHGGCYWMVDATGTPSETHKQIYALAFAIFAFSEYYRMSGNTAARDVCKDLYRWIERYSFDTRYNGYFEAFDRCGAPLDDVRLSTKDQNDPKTMNTHLHILEAYTNLYRIWSDAELRERLTNLLTLFTDRIISPSTAHLNLFFGDDWTLNSTTVSFGHDIEASWLLDEAADVLGDKLLHDRVTGLLSRVVDAASEGLQPDGSLYHEYNAVTHEYVKYREWWVSAEAAVGYMNAYERYGNELYLTRSLNAWEFIKRYLCDYTNGEWFWGVDDAHGRIADVAKVSRWKCPYHNTRFCMELMRRCGRTLTAV